ncbi:MAG TPA: hypothetical protein VGS20_16470 [Candidatus Acidoferrales bacterium]|nr:hypothetical protein [Candidatus Acidoferrales bacterium]
MKVSQTDLRTLCQAGLIAARATTGGDWRIPNSEVQRLRKDGLPELPSPVLEGSETQGQAAPGERGRPHPALLSAPSQEAIAAADDVVRLENEVHAIDLKRAKEESLDWFRDRRSRQKAADAARRRAALEAQAGRIRREWLAQWMAYGLEGLSEDMPREAELDVHQAIEEALANLGPGHPHHIVDRLVLAAVEKALAPWRRRKEIQKAIAEAPDQLPFLGRGPRGRPSEWDIQAIRAASDAIEQLDPGAPMAKIRAVAFEAARKVKGEFQAWRTAEEHRKVREYILEWTIPPLELTPGEREAAKRAVLEALAKLPAGCGLPEMRRVKDAALAPSKPAPKPSARPTVTLCAWASM